MCQKTRARSQALVGFLDQLPAILALQAPDLEMPSRHVVEVADEQGVHYASSYRSNGGDRHGGRLLRHDDSKAGGNPCQKPNQGGRALGGKTSLRDMLSRIGQGSRQGTSDRIIPGLDRVISR